jgi:hypothetical protein
MAVLFRKKYANVVFEVTDTGLRLYLETNRWFRENVPLHLAWEMLGEIGAYLPDALICITSPSDGSVDVDIHTDIIFTFNHPIVPGSYTFVVTDSGGTEIA